MLKCCQIKRVPFLKSSKKNKTHAPPDPSPLYPCRFTFDHVVKLLPLEVLDLGLEIDLVNKVCKLKGLI